MPQTEDPIRAEVERVLHAAVGTAIALPLATVNGVRRCIGRRVTTMRRRLTEPAAFVRSLFELVGSPAQAPVPAGRAVAAAPPVGDPGRPDTTPAAAPDVADTLPIEEYESLAASQVVARLPALTAAELAEVRRFEATHRGRRTVLGRIDQLLVPT
jgi:hypothetical protein